MAKKEPKVMSVVTVPLKTEKWQEDVLQKRFELCRKIYNNMLHYEKKQLNKAIRDKRYVDAKRIINDTYKIVDEKEKKEKKKSEEYKNAVQVSNDVLKEYGLTEFGFTNGITPFRKVYQTNIPSVVGNISIAKPMWAAMEKLLFGNGKTVHYKKYNTWASMASDGKSGIRMINAEGKTMFNREKDEPMFICMSSPKGRKLVMPMKIDKKDLYKIEMLTHKLKIIRITRKLCGSKYQYYAQLTVEGAPAVRYDKDGNEKNPVGTGKIGIYSDTTSITLALENGETEKFSLNRDNNSQDKIVELQRYMDNSRRAMNPDNYNEDGTIKKGIMEDGKRRKLRWVESNGYKKAKLELQNLYRIESEKRRLEHQILSNKILSYGNEIVVNDYAFQAAAMRKQIKNETTGETERHKKAGKAIGENAPATLVALLENKLKTKTGNAIMRIKLEEVDYTKENYREFYAQELLNQIL